MRTLVFFLAVALAASVAIAANVRATGQKANATPIASLEWRCPKCGGDHKVVAMQTSEHIWLADGTMLTIPPPPPKIVVVDQCPPRATFAAKPPANHPQAFGWPQPRWLLEEPRPLVAEKPLPAPTLLPAK